jgi:hypothetical protein
MNPIIYAKDGELFRITFDEYNVIDTISQQKSGEWIELDCKNRYVKFFLNNSEKIVARINFKDAEMI